jgi:hypothetical protein
MPTLNGVKVLNHAGRDWAASRRALVDFNKGDHNTPDTATLLPANPAYRNRTVQ